MSNFSSATRTQGATEAPIVSSSLEQYLLLKAGAVTVAVPILAVREILEPPELTAVPKSPDWFEGLANLRGQVLPVLHLSRRLRLSEATVAARPVLVVIDFSSALGKQQRGLLVDSLGGIVDATADETKSYEGVGVTIAREFVTGLLPVGSEFALQLNLSQVFADDERD